MLNKLIESCNECIVIRWIISYALISIAITDRLESIDAQMSKVIRRDNLRTIYRIIPLPLLNGLMNAVGQPRLLPLIMRFAARVNFLSDYDRYCTAAILSTFSPSLWIKKFFLPEDLDSDDLNENVALTRTFRRQFSLFLPWTIHQPGDKASMSLLALLL